MILVFFFKNFLATAIMMDQSKAVTSPLVRVSALPASRLSLSPFFSLEHVLQCGREREIAMLSSSPAADLKSCASLFERVGSKFFKASKDHQKIGRSRYIMLQFFFIKY